MKPFLFLALLLATAPNLCGQGRVNFRNRVAGSSGLLFAPVYGVNPAAPGVRLSGNANTNGGAIDYTGVPLLHGTTYTASLWAAPMQQGLVAPEFQLLATTPFRPTTLLAGVWLFPFSDPVVPFATGDMLLVTLQVRAWDNGNGTVPTWADVLADPMVPRGYSDEFSYLAQPAPLPLEPMYGLSSFNLTAVPEPSLLALGAVAALAAAQWARQRGARRGRTS